MLWPSTVMMLFALFSTVMSYFIRPEWVLTCLLMAIGFGIATLGSRALTGRWTLAPNKES